MDVGEETMNNTTRIRDRQYFSLRQSILDPPIEYDDGFEELLRQTWNIWAVSTLFDFQYDDDVKLKLYAKKLREEIATILIKDEVSYDVKISVMDNLGPTPNPSDSPAVKIEVTMTLGTVQRNIYKGYLISWRTQLAEPDDNNVHLPLLMSRGSQSAMNAVNLIISRMFDCTIVALPINESDLKWILTINLCPDNLDHDERKQDLVFLEHVVPGLPLTETITIKFRVEDLKEMWTIVSKNKRDEASAVNIKAEHVEAFFRAIHKQMFEVGSLRLGFCLLHKLNLPFLTISGNRMKAMNIQAFTNTLLYLNEKALEVLYALHFQSASLNSTPT